MWLSNIYLDDLDIFSSGWLFGSNTISCMSIVMYLLLFENIFSILWKVTVLNTEVLTLFERCNHNCKFWFLLPSLMLGFWPSICEASSICSIWVGMLGKVGWTWGLVRQRDSWKAEGCGTHTGRWNAQFLVYVKILVQYWSSILFPPQMELIRKG